MKVEIGFPLLYVIKHGVIEHIEFEAKQDIVEEAVVLEIAQQAFARLKQVEACRMRVVNTGVGIKRTPGERTIGRADGENKH